MLRSFVQKISYCIIFTKHFAPCREHKSACRVFFTGRRVKCHRLAPRLFLFIFFAACFGGLHHLWYKHRDPAFPGVAPAGILWACTPPSPRVRPTWRQRPQRRRPTISSSSCRERGRRSSSASRSEANLMPANFWPGFHPCSPLRALVCTDMFLRKVGSE
jgi:hypothetical protein